MSEGTFAHGFDGSHQPVALTAIPHLQTRLRSRPRLPPAPTAATSKQPAVGTGPSPALLRSDQAASRREHRDHTGDQARPITSSQADSWACSRAGSRRQKSHVPSSKLRQTQRDDRFCL